MIRDFRFLISLVALAFSQTASAQSFPVNPLDMNGWFISQSLTDECEEECDEDAPLIPQAILAPKAETSPPADMRSADLSFIPEPQIRQQADRDFIELLRQDNPELAGAFASGNYLPKFAASTESMGLPYNDLSASIALLFTGLWEIANHEPYEPQAKVSAEDLRKFDALRGFVANLMMTSQSPILDSDESKQTASDKTWHTVLLLAMLQQNAHEGRGGSPSDLSKQAQALGRQILGIDLRDVNLTTDGFVPRDPAAFAKKYAANR